MEKFLTNNDRPFERAFLGNHPPVSMAALLVKGKKYLAGEVLGRVTANGKIKALDAAADDGSEHAIAVLAGDVDATESDEPCIIYVHAELIDAGLIWPEGITAVQKDAAILKLQALGLYVN